MNRATPWVIALLVSVLANGAMLGLTLHSVSGGPRFDRGHDHTPPAGLRGDGFSVRAFLGALPPEDRESAAGRLRDGRDEVIAHMRDVRDAQQAVEAALRREPFDAEAVRSAMQNLRAARGELEGEIERAIIDIIADLPPEERMRVLEQGMRGDQGRRGLPPHRRPGDGPMRDGPPREG
ncbi:MULTISPECIES: periplasmic heavy metal sensor [Hyphobacterium]|uniref:Periplasmic heavy metal sensor n=1 Tax=Hyphobacterium vulgare TaxID=1736751 RepID=A0ABV6ZUN0_9PROT